MSMETLSRTFQVLRQFEGGSSEFSLEAAVSPGKLKFEL
jgi:hypothetical protein